MKQEKALAILKSGRNVFLTGSAGTGKTFVLNQYIDFLKERKIAVAITASTGIAATHMNGMTIHSWAGIGIKETLTSKQLKELKTKKYLKEHFEKVKVLIIDEISMLHQNQFQLVDVVLRYFKENEEAFGGIQIVVSGDFFQLPPIGKSGEKSKDKFAFMAPSWVQANFNICYLDQQFRQEDHSLNDILNQIRQGYIGEAAILKLKDCKNHQLPFNEEPTRLYTHNIDVDQLNQEFLGKIKGKVEKRTAETKGNEKLIETLKNSVLAPTELSLKVGAKVMFVKNNHEKGYVNGSLGEVVDFDEEEGFPFVRLTNGDIVIAEPERWPILDEKGTTLASFEQIPLRLAWAITVHKSQGMTLEAAEVDLSKTFETGQGYVALSRLKSLDKLRLVGFNEMALKIDALAFKADQRFQKLSEEIDLSLEQSALEKEVIPFVKSCEGLTDLKALKKHRTKLKEKANTKKDSTYEITYQYLKQKFSLEEIAEERGMTVGTICSHFIKIKKDHPEANLSHYKPSSTIVNQVEMAYKKTKTSDGVSLKTIHDTLNGKVSYQNIKLSLAFII